MNRLLFVAVFSAIFLLIDYYAFQAVKALTANHSENFQKGIKIIYFFDNVVGNCRDNYLQFWEP